MAVDARLSPALHSLLASGVIRLRNLEDGGFKVARPLGWKNENGVQNRAHCFVVPAGEWHDPVTGRKGVGLFSLGAYLEIDLGDLTRAFGGVEP